ncbi:hypothetical protein [Caldimonas sp. KR1-144]|uniref:hypothetical protein n=1 Tax=Caldimonas sp. KR1-144 TaxID=3400911 RepID=UPI003C0F54E1
MDTLLALINAAACGLIAAVLLWAILSPRVHDGIVIKVGLIGLCAGFGSIALRMVDGLKADDLVGMARSILLINAGIAVVILGYLLRRARAGHPLRRVPSDWVDLHDDHLHHVSGGKQ